MELGDDQTLRTATVGGCYPYWWLQDGAVHWSRSAEDAVTSQPVEARVFDPVAALSILSVGYICLDRTLVQGVQRLPWMSEVRADGQVDYFRAPPHGKAERPQRELAAEFYEAYQQELRDYCRGRTTIYVLLSGGMDSRIMAGALRSLEVAGDLDGEIQAICWGEVGARDVVYSKRIASLFGWKWEFLPLDAERYWENFETCVRWLGVEVDPKHLHRMRWFENAAPNSVVLAASYGDSIGRAEFSSIHLRSVPPLVADDRFRFLTREALLYARPRLVEDIRAIRGRHGARSETGWREIERQAHYMRRMLSTTLCVIDNWSEIHQSFVSPGVFSLVWAQSPSNRGNEMYEHILRLMNPALLEVPWARTGAKYGETEPQDSLPKSFHQYGLWLRRDHAGRLGSLLFSGALESLGVFDMVQVRWMFREWKRERVADNTSLATHLSWLAAVSRFAELYDVKGPDLESHPAVNDRARALALRHGARVSQVARRVTRPWRVRT